MGRGRPKKRAATGAPATTTTSAPDLGHEGQLPEKRTRTLTTKAAELASSTGKSNRNAAGPFKTSSEADTENNVSTPATQDAAESGRHPEQSGNSAVNAADQSLATSGSTMEQFTTAMTGMLNQMQQMQQMLASQQQAILTLHSLQQPPSNGASTSSATAVPSQQPPSAAGSQAGTVRGTPLSPGSQATSTNQTIPSSVSNNLLLTGNSAAHSLGNGSNQLATASPDTAPQPRQMITAGMPLGQNIPLKTKQDIWDDQYVDMAALLYPDTHSTFGIQLCGNAESGGVGELKLTKNTKVIKSFTEWQKAFNMYVSIYIQKPGRAVEAGDMLTYMSDVQHMAECNLDWLTYDTMYRQDRANNPAHRMPWSTLNINAHNHILRKRSAGLDPPASSSGYRSPFDSNKNHKQEKFTAGSIKIPYGYCFDYHTRGKTCTKQGCGFTHRCFKCNSPKNHPIFLCDKYSNVQNNHSSSNHGSSNHGSSNHGSKKPYHKNKSSKYSNTQKDHS